MWYALLFKCMFNSIWMVDWMFQRPIMLCECLRFLLGWRNCSRENICWVFKFLVFIDFQGSVHICSTYATPWLCLWYACPRGGCLNFGPKQCRWLLGLIYLNGCQCCCMLYLILLLTDLTENGISTHQMFLLMREMFYIIDGIFPIIHTSIVSKSSRLWIRFFVLLKFAVYVNSIFSVFSDMLIFSFNFLIAITTL